MKKLLQQKGFTLIELMVVIVIVGILAAVAIPKFTMASHKAKASEFPTALTSIYTAEHAYEAEIGSFTDVIGGAGIDVDPNTLSSVWFSYGITGPSTSTFTAGATVIKGFGDAEIGKQAFVNQSASKWGSAELLNYARNWR